MAERSSRACADATESTTNPNLLRLGVVYIDGGEL